MTPTVSPMHYDVFTVVSSLTLACFIAWLAGRAVRNKKEEKEEKLRHAAVAGECASHHK